MPAKTIKFDPASETDMELYEWLKRLGYGDFTSRSKEMWQAVMNNETTIEREIARHLRLRENENGG